MTLEEADRMIDVCRRQGVLLMYAEELYFTPKYVQAKQMADEGAFGKVYLVKQSEKHFGPHGDWFWNVDRSGGGVLMDMGCHGIAFCWWFLGRPAVKSVYCQMGTYVHGDKTRGEDNSLCIMEFEGNAVGVIENSWARRGGMDDCIEVYGEGGVTYADLHMGNALPTYSEYGYGYAVEKAPSTKGWTYPVFEELWNYGFPQEMRHFARCVRGKETPICTGEDGRVVQEVLYAAYESARTGRKVALPFRPAGGETADRPVVGRKGWGNMKIILFDQSQIGRLHEASIHIWKRSACMCPMPKCSDCSPKRGPRSISTAQQVWIPEKVVQQCLAMAGKQFTLYGRDRDRRAEFGMGRRNYNSSAGQALWIDDDTVAAMPRWMTSARPPAWPTACRGSTSSGAMADPHELPVECRCVRVAAEQLKHTTKPITFWFHDRASARFILELFTIVAGSEAEAAALSAGVSVPGADQPACGFPIAAWTCCSRPAASTCRCRSARWPRWALRPWDAGRHDGPGERRDPGGAVHHATDQPGTPVCYGGIPHAFDMRTTQVIFGGPEQALMAVGLTELGHSYGLPVYINVGLTDSKLPDAQAGLEAGITLACGAMAGADIFGHLGICGADQALRCRCSCSSTRSSATSSGCCKASRSATNTWAWT